MTEAVHLARGRSEDVPQKVAAALAELEEVETLMRRELDLELQGLDMLDVGAGQLHMQMTYFLARGNDVVGIDQDVIVQGASPRAYAEMLRANGPRRVLKTLGRKALLVDLRYRRELARQLGIDRLPVRDVLRMDAANTAFPDGAFDFVYALAVFQHVEYPADVLDEMIRVLRPGGAFYLDFILYTSRGGSHDVRLLGGQDGVVAHWAHLRDDLEGSVQPNAYLNRIRLPDWVKTFESRMPGVRIELKQPDADRLESEARALWDRGQLTDFTLDELLTTKVAVLWRKPLDDQPTDGDAASSSVIVVSR